MSKLEIVCPCCQAELLVEGKTGVILHSEAKKAAYSFDDAVRKEKERHEKSDELFAKAVADEKQRKHTLEDRFKAILDSKDELDEPPPRPFDLD
jgi:hypothetical protein